MIDLLLGIFFFNLILILFKLFEKFNVDNLQAIIVNYIVATSLGFATSETPHPFNKTVSSDWLWYAIVIGFLFIVVFNLLASSTQKIGIAISTVANKMSVIIPVIFAFVVFHDQISFLKIMGLILALIGVYFTTTNGKKLNFDKKYLWLILVIFFGQGIADSIFNYAQKFHVESTDAKIFIATMFFAACITGIFMLIAKIINGKSKFQFKSIGWGILLGIPNFLTVFYFFNALESEVLQASQVYPILNMGVIVLSALTGYLLFKENLKTINWIGIFVSILAIAAITFG